MMLVEKDGAKSYVEMEETGHKEYASKCKANTALGFGIAGTALGILNSGIFSNGLFGLGGGNCHGAATAAGINYVERKECEDFVTLLNGMWQKSYNHQQERFADRQVLNQELFGIYSAMRNGFDAINATANKNAFDLYKYSRDSKDELSAEIGALRTEVAVMKATRPYQDALIQCDIQRSADQTNFNLWQRTCRMISGEVVLPNTPTVTGFGSYNPCMCTPSTGSVATASK